MIDINTKPHNSAKSVLELMLSISNQQTAYQKKNQQPNQLTQARVSVISILIDKGPKSLSSLSLIRNVTTATMSKLVSTLVTDGLVLRAKSKLDQRSKIFMVTSKGRAAVVDETAMQIQRVKAAIGNLPTEQQNKIENSVELLTKIMTFL